MSANAVRLVKAATDAPLSVDEAKEHLRVLHSAEDSLIERYIRASTTWFERYTRRQLVKATFELRMDAFPHSGGARVDRGHTPSNLGGGRSNQHTYRQLRESRRHRAIQLPKGKCLAIEQITYIDANDVTQTLSGPTSPAPGTDYQEDLEDNDAGFAIPPITGAWPGDVNTQEANGVRVKYCAGFGKTCDDIPEDIRQALAFRTADFFNARDSSDTGTHASAFSSTWFQAAQDIADLYAIEIL